MFHLDSKVKFFLVEWYNRKRGKNCYFIPWKGMKMVANFSRLDWVLCGIVIAQVRPIHVLNMLKHRYLLQNHLAEIVKKRPALLQPHQPFGKVGDEPGNLRYQ